MKSINLPTHLALLALLSCVQLASCSCSDWHSVETQQYLPEDLAIQGRRGQNVLACVSSASSMSGLVVVQFDSDSTQCSAFRLSDVCHLIGALASDGVSEMRRCAAFVNARAANFMRLSSRLRNTAGSKLRAAWVMSEDEDASTSNLVCGQAQPLTPPSAVEWSSEGAQIRDASSSLILSNVELGEVQGAFSLLFRLKMTDSSYLVFTNSICGTSDIRYYLEAYPTIYLYSASFNLEFRRYSETQTDLYDSVYCKPDIGASNFLDLAIVSASQNVSQLRFFTNSINCPVSQDNYVFQMRSPWSLPNLASCYSVRVDGNIIVRAVAIANDSLTETEIKDFFNAVR